MQTIYQFLPFIIIGIAILVFGNKLKNIRGMLPQNLSTLMPNNIQASYENKMPILAQELGLKYSENTADPSDKKTFMNSGCEMHGEYRAHNIELVMGVSAKHIGFSTGSYSYKMSKFISFEVENSDKKNFHIQPRSKNIVAKDTGEKLFDEKLMVSGNAEIPAEFLHYFGQFGWLNLKLEENHLIFNDTFYEDLLQTEGTSAMMIARHPIWGSTPQNPGINVENVKTFINKIIDLSEALKLK